MARLNLHSLTEVIMNAFTNEQVYAFDGHTTAGRL